MREVVLLGNHRLRPVFYRDSPEAAWRRRARAVDQQALDHLGQAQLGRQVQGRAAVRARVRGVRVELARAPAQ